VTTPVNGLANGGSAVARFWRPPCLAEGSVCLRAFWSEDAAQGMVEYTLVIIVIAIVMIVMLVWMKDSIGNFFSNVGNALT